MRMIRWLIVMRDSAEACERECEKSEKRSANKVVKVRFFTWKTPLLHVFVCSSCRETQPDIPRRKPM